MTSSWPVKRAGLGKGSALSTKAALQPEAGGTSLRSLCGPGGWGGRAGLRPRHRATAAQGPAPHSALGALGAPHLTEASLQPWARAVSPTLQMRKLRPGVVMRNPGSPTPGAELPPE